jgi:hypothetical protein
MLHPFQNDRLFTPNLPQLPDILPHRTVTSRRDDSVVQSSSTFLLSRRICSKRVERKLLVRDRIFQANLHAHTIDKREEAAVQVSCPLA